MAEKDKKTIIKELMEKGKKNGVLSFKEITNALQDTDITPDQVEKLYDTLEKLGVELVVKKYDVPKYARDNKLSEEEAGRKLRYASFRQVLSERGYNKIAVAHCMVHSASYSANKNKLICTHSYSCFRSKLHVCFIFM